jgi:hypothetical protein
MIHSSIYRQKLTGIYAALTMSFLLISPERLSSGTTETYDYRVDFIVVPSVDLTMKISQTTYDGKPVDRLQFYTKTKKVFSTFFSVNNYYESLYDPTDFSIQFGKKIIEQPNVKQEITSVYRNSHVEYSNGKSVSIPPKTHNFFSLLMHIRTLSANEIRTFRVPVEIEGKLFDASLKYIGEERLPVGDKTLRTDRIEILLSEMTPGQSPVTKLTDIFYWKIGSEEGKRTVWLEKGNRRRIVRTEFYISATWLTARLIDEE